MVEGQVGLSPLRPNQSRTSRSTENQWEEAAPAGTRSQLTIRSRVKIWLSLQRGERGHQNRVKKQTHINSFCRLKVNAISGLCQYNSVHCWGWASESFRNGQMVRTLFESRFLTYQSKRVCSLYVHVAYRMKERGILHEEKDRLISGGSTAKPLLGRGGGEDRSFYKQCTCSSVH